MVYITILIGLRECVSVCRQLCVSPAPAGGQSMCRCSDQRAMSTRKRSHYFWLFVSCTLYLCGQYKICRWQDLYIISLTTSGKKNSISSFRYLLTVHIPGDMLYFCFCNIQLWQRVIRDSVLLMYKYMFVISCQTTDKLRMSFKRWKRGLKDHTSNIVCKSAFSGSCQ